MYLGAASDNKASTALCFFLQSVEKYGVPNRVRADQGCENVDIASWMFTVRGCGRGSFMSGKSVHNQRIERLWRDLCTYYDVLHSLEEEGLLDPADSIHLFAVHYVFLPRLQADLENFSAAWENHPLRTEQNLTPNQLWEMGCIQNPIPPPPDFSEGLFDIEIESQQAEVNAGIVLPSVACPLNSEGLEELAQLINPSGPSQDHGRDIYISVLNYVLHENTV
ncbi:hypothetical protein AMEX_G10666 [Astyanax mexicanus]|uniref:Integrase core domain-containing protein n=1 Tax=Astyanax mexicanus TaxID=7994 RepID=A0A8T2LSM7_ASTMX|nr:hypothetical protein AMEX_G10666 [Astyanax mexicanus]